MPVIVNAETPHPFLPSLGDPAAIEAERARRQDIRPMDVVILNLMADKMTTEKQLARWLGNSMLQVNLTFAATDDYLRGIYAGREPRNTPSGHIKDIYRPFSEIREQPFDGLIVTGVNALQPRVEDEAFWPDVQEILNWSTTHVFSSLFLCWGAKAALKHFHDIDSIKGEQKLFGLFDHCIVSDRTGLLADLPDRFAVPVSRWKSPRREDILKHPALEIVADSEESGPNIIVEAATDPENGSRYQHRVYVLNHPEYETDTLKQEYVRDSAESPATPLPLHYFPGDDPAREPANSWRHVAHLYTRWIADVYEATPYNPANIIKAPQPGNVKVIDRLNAGPSIG